MTAGLTVEADPASVALITSGLRRLDDHFRRYVDDGRLAGWLLTVSRHGKLAHIARYGQRDAEAGLPVEDDTLWRIYSMTKPITSVAAMMLYEQGALELTDPVSRFIPSFTDMRVFAGGSDVRPVTVPATEPVRIWHLLTHTAGLSNAAHRQHPVDALYRAVRRGPETTLADACEQWARLPLLFEPGTAWNYSVATHVLGRVLEVVSGQPLDEFFARRVLGPLGMTDTGFYAPPGDLHRLATLYTPDEDGRATPWTAPADDFSKPPVLPSPGGGLLSTAADYNRLLTMLLPLPGSPAGKLDGTRLLSPRTVAFMGRNHLPGNADLAQFGMALNGESPRGTGFGLGFAVVLDPVPGHVVASAGELSWHGAASTAFWIDPAEELAVTFFTQLMPASLPVRPQLRQLVYAALD